ncbi:unnamed protein product, partial [Rotaria sp. Silwood2]
MSINDILLIADPILDRFCINILPRIGLNIKSLILESESMERILLAADYPNLAELKLLNFNNKIASHYFTVKSPVHRIFQKQITDLILDDLPNLKCFSLKYSCLTEQYDSKILPLLRHTSNLEEFTLNATIQKPIRFVDRTQINNQILVHMPRLYKFIFYISTEIKLHHLVPCLSSDDIQQTFTNIRYQQVACLLNHCYDTATCHVFSLPFVFDHIRYIGNTFPSIVFSHVTNLGVHDVVPFEHEFFLRIACFFPMLEKLDVINFKSQSQISDNMNSNDNQLCSIVEYPYLILVRLGRSHIDYYEQFLNDTKTHLPRLTALTVNYDQLTIVTENFTRDATRLNCANVKELIIQRTLVHSKDFYVYFPV